MLSVANRDKYGELKHSMAENYMTGTSEYPESPEVVLHILSKYTPPQDETDASSKKGVVELKERCLHTQKETPRGRRT
jgi:hypothetical protein